MRLNLHILADELAEFDPQTKCSESTTLDLVGARVPDGSPWQQGYVYVADDESLGALERGEGTPNVIYVGERGTLEQALPRWRGVVIRPEHAQCSSQVLSRVLAAFERFALWEQKVLRAMAARCSLQELLDVGSEVLGNPVALLDASDALVAWSGDVSDVRRGKSIWNETIGLGFARRDYLSFEERRSIDRMMQTASGEPLVIQTGHYGDEVQCVAVIRKDGRIVCKLACTDAVSSLTNAERSRFRAVRDLVGLGLESCGDASLVVHGAATLMDRLLSGETVSKDATMQMLSLYGWRHDDSFIEVLFRNREMTGGSMSGAANLIVSELRPAHVSVQEEGILAVFRQAGVFDTTALMRSLGALCDRLGLVCGFSIAFRGVEYLVPMREQALVASRLASAEVPVRGIMDGYFEALASVVSDEFDLRALCDPSILSLAKCDESGPDLVRTLATFLSMGGNASAASRELFIHRNTLAHRIERISREVGIDIDGLTSEQTVQLLVSCAVALRSQ